MDTDEYRSQRMVDLSMDIDGRAKSGENFSEYRWIIESEKE